MRWFSGSEHFQGTQTRFSSPSLGGHSPICSPDTFRHTTVAQAYMEAEILIHEKKIQLKTQNNVK